VVLFDVGMPAQGSPPTSSWHDEEQPSFEERSPSSHSSGRSTVPLPHSGPAVGVRVKVRVWVADPLSPLSSRNLLLEVAKRAIEEAGIEIPFPYRVVRLVDERAEPGGR